MEMEIPDRSMDGMTPSAARGTVRMMTKAKNHDSRIAAMMMNVSPMAMKSAWPSSPKVSS